ncbi:MAG: PEP-CTERM sorting domain-containing protein [Gammaproteobacteria bacterium]|nr:PEP-CTERM sorting domain-containing protein [Gammaproteobacteria bacterium]
MKRLIACTLAALALMASVSAQAALIGDFASGDWTAYLSGGSVDVNAPDSITLQDPAEYVATATEQQNLEFDYEADLDLGVCVNNSCNTYSETGSKSLLLNPGDVIKLVSDWDDYTTISNLRTSGVRSNLNAVPEPATPALLGAGLLLGLALFGRRKAE